MQSLPFFYFVRIRCNPTAVCHRTCRPGRHHEGSDDSQGKHGHNLYRDTPAPCRKTDRRRVRTVRSAAGVDPCGRSGIPIPSFNHSPARKNLNTCFSNGEGWLLHALLLSYNPYNPTERFHIPYIRRRRYDNQRHCLNKTYHIACNSRAFPCTYWVRHGSSYTIEPSG